MLKDPNLVEREEAQDSIADYVATGQFAPLAGVIGAVGGAIIAHYEDIAGLHDFVGVDEGGGVFAFVFDIGIESVWMLLIVDSDSAIFNDYSVAGETNNALNKHSKGIFGKAKDNNLATGRDVLLVLAEGAFDEVLGVAELGDNEIVGVVESGDHAGADNVVGLENKVVKN